MQLNNLALKFTGVLKWEWVKLEANFTHVISSYLSYNIRSLQVKENIRIETKRKVK